MAKLLHCTELSLDFSIIFAEGWDPGSQDHKTILNVIKGNKYGVQHPSPLAPWSLAPKAIFFFFKSGLVPCCGPRCAPLGSTLQVCWIWVNTASLLNMGEHCQPGKYIHGKCKKIYWTKVINIHQKIIYYTPFFSASNKGYILRPDCSLFTLRQFPEFLMLDFVAQC